jgi:general secretion pathway protein K
MSGRSRDTGYAMIAAVAAVAIFALLALQTLSAGRGAVAGAHAEAVRARLLADADAGIAMGIHSLGLRDPAQRWRLKGETHTLDFNGDTLVVGVEDEGGKIPLNYITAPRVRTLFQLAGAPPDQADTLVRDFLNMRDGPNGETSAGLASASHDILTSVDQLALLKSMTPALYARIAPNVTVNGIDLSFDPRTASPLARAVMSPGGRAAPLPPETDDDAQPPIELAGRAVTIRAEVRGAEGAVLRRTAIIEFTGAPARPFVIRALD